MACRKYNGVPLHVHCKTTRFGTSMFSKTTQRHVKKFGKETKTITMASFIVIVHEEANNSPDHLPKAGIVS